MYLWISWNAMLGVKLEYFLCLTLFDQVSGVQSDVLVQDLKILLDEGKANTLWKCSHVSTLTCLGEEQMNQHLFRGCVDTFLPLSSLSVHVKGSHHIYSNQLIENTAKLLGQIDIKNELYNY